MTTQEKDLIRESFDRIRELSEPVCLLFYGRLFDLDPSLRRLFHTDMKIQSKKLMEMLAAIVDNLDHLDRLRPQLQELGRRHTEYGVKDEHYDTLAAALLWAFGPSLATQPLPWYQNSLAGRHPIR